MTLQARKRNISYFRRRTGERSSTYELNCLKRIINSSDSLIVPPFKTQQKFHVFACIVVGDSEKSIQIKPAVLLIPKNQTKQPTNVYRLMIFFPAFSSLLANLFHFDGSLLIFIPYENQKSHCEAKNPLAGKVISIYFQSLVAHVSTSSLLSPSQCSVNQPRKPQKKKLFSIHFECVVAHREKK